MTKKLFLSAVCFWALVLVLTLAAKAEVLKKGTYMASGEGNWSIEFDGASKITVRGDGEIAAEGTYKINGEELEISDKSGPRSCGEESAGKYKWHLEGKKLSFVTIEDACEGRAQVLTSQSWTLNEASK